MHILLLNQTFYPDVAATAQYASDLAARLAGDGHQVTVISSRRCYVDPRIRHPWTEEWRGVKILRCPASGFGKDAKWRRALDFGSFLVTCGMRSLLLRKIDAVISLTTPPLLSAVGAVIARLNGARFVYWVMDLNPDQAIAAAWP
jgi:colanic acid biosynthesis glycosyl transferase WcaI